MAMAAVTDVVPSRRMAVARGRLDGGPESFDADALAAARVAGTLAAKDCARLVATAPPFQLTDCFVSLERDGAAWVATATCVGYARATLETAALLGVAASLAALWDAAKHADPAATTRLRMSDLHVVQNVEG